MPFSFPFVFFLPSLQRQESILLKPTREFGEGKRCKLPSRCRGPATIAFCCIVCSRNAFDCSISGSVVSIATSGKIKANPGPGRIWNLIMGVFRGSPRGTAPPIVQETFAASVYGGVISKQWLQQNSARTLLRQHSSVAAASSFQASTDCWPFIGTLYLTKCEFERVFWNLPWTTSIE